MAMNFDNLFWEDLLLYLEQGQVIPIIGQDLLTVEVEGRSVNAYRLMAERFAQELKIPTESLPQDFTLSQVIAAYPRFREKRSLIYSQTKATFDRLALVVPESLRLLARIPAFRIFVTTTFDPWMERALVEERFGGTPRALSIGYSPGEAPDLTTEQLASDEPIVFQLFGRVSAAPQYGVTEEDLLEYIHRLQARPPKNLCDALRDHHLLFIGNAFSDWLARFFVRTARGDRLSAPHGKEIFIVDDEFRRSSAMTSFFQGFCWETNILAENTPVEFVRLLYEKWVERNPQTSSNSPIVADAGHEPGKPASHSIFISYANEDFEAALRVRGTLDRLGLNVWMDKKGGVEAGDLYQAKIRRDIWHCTLFIPLLSRNAECRKEAFFREEWDDALKRMRRFKGSSRPFIVPVVIDDLNLYASTDIPEEFKEIHVTAAKQGILSNDAALRVQQITRSIIKAEGGAV
jgi:TIR domain/SIR2-like domain